ncbi:MAG: GHKL domain-containing protein [Spirochaetales bacterium]|nr:GHKL domain-containing protein [Spirochaetales bacterium]
MAERTAELKTKNEELEAFSGSISHDLRAPLRAVQGWARALREDYADLLPSGALDLVGRQEVAAMRMMEMIEDLLRLSRLSKHPLRLRNWDPAETIKEVWQMVIAADPAGNRARLLQSGDLPACEADPALLRQVLGNLLENALKFSRDKDMPQIKIQGWIESGECIYSIEDNGIGFNPAYARRIFQPFQRLHSLRHFEGNGIGLATVKRIITRHGGRIWAHSVPGEGATFFFALPLSMPALEEAAPTGKVR